LTLVLFSVQHPLYQQLGAVSHSMLCAISHLYCHSC
jgi:hypothetical protein